MDSSADSISSALTRQQPAMVKMLRQLVECESPSTDKTAVDGLGKMMATMLVEQGATVRVIPSRITGNHLRAEFQFAKKNARQILLLGHMDTVWELGTLARMPFRVRRSRAYGPGAFDMKAGIVIALYALEALRNFGIPLKKNVVLLLNADEEIGSPSSRPTTEREARRSDYALVVEPPHGPSGALKTARKGVGEFMLTVHGRAAHAGIEPDKGANAIVELMRQVLMLEVIKKHIGDATLNTTIIRGGTRSNVIPDAAEAHLDVRVVHSQDQRIIEKHLRSLSPVDRRTTVCLSGGFNRPPMERTRQSAVLFERARRLARPLGIDLTETAVGGGSDGNFTAALGVPTLDGLGVVGDGAHAAHEHVVLRELPRRAALLAHLIASLGAE
ncbi:MAG: M20 family metallopeptidase [Acidobacteria bacterium]|nr:M20 family metallopeptidase [Acidobacteriota bacterium]